MLLNNLFLKIIMKVFSMNNKMLERRIENEDK